MKTYRVSTPKVCGGTTRLNEREKAIYEAATRHGWEAHHKGLPDFICFRGEEVLFIEVKGKCKNRNQAYKLSKYQHRVRELLVAAGFTYKVIAVQ